MSHPMPQEEPVKLYLAWQCSECDGDNVNAGVICGTCGGWGPNAAEEGYHVGSSVSVTPGAVAGSAEIAGNRPENADRPQAGYRDSPDWLRERLRDTRSKNAVLQRQLRLAEAGVKWRERLIADLELRNERLLSGRNHWRRVAQAETALRAALGHPTLTICHTGPSPKEGLYCTLFRDHEGQTHVSAVDGFVQARWKDE